MRAGGGWLLAAGSLSWAVAQWFLFWMFARFAGGPEAVGAYSLVLSIATPVFTLTQVGLRTVYLSFSINYPWRSFVVLRLVGLLSASALLAAFFASVGIADTGLWIAILVLKIADLYFDILQARIQRGGRLAALGLLNVINSAATVIAAGLVVWATGSVTAAIYASAVVSGLVAIAAQRLALQQTFTPVVEVSGYGPIFRAGMPTALSEALASLANYLPIILLARIAEESRVGVYSTAAYLLTVANLVGAIAKNVLITTFRLTVEQEGFRPLLQRTHKIALALGALALGAAPVIILSGDPVLRWVYGDGFGMSQGELAVLAVATLPIAPGYIYSTALNVLNRFTSQAWSWGIVFVLGILAGAVCLISDVDDLSVALAVAATLSWARLAVVVGLTLRAGRR